MFAEAESGVRNSQKEVINISELVEEACELFEPAAEQKKIRLSWQTLPDRIINGDKQSVQRMLANLLD